MRLELFNKCTEASKNYLIKNGYYSDTGVFLPKLEASVARTDDPTFESTDKTGVATVTGNTNCAINLSPIINFAGTTAPPGATGAGITWPGSTGPGEMEGAGAEELKDTEQEATRREDTERHQRALHGLSLIHI